MNILEHYKETAMKFDKEFHSITINTEESITWPDGYGVYVIWKIDKLSLDNLIYIGLTGRFIRNSNNQIVLNSGLFPKRKDRWTPFRFCENENDCDLKFSFRFKPRESNTSLQRNIKFQKDAYSETIYYRDGIILDFFIFNKDINLNHGYTPALLESELLTKYYIETNNLPPANNAL